MILAIQIVVAIIIFSLLIVIHELGHMWTAKAFGVRVNEFSVGMGPSVFQWGKGETTYSIRAIPMGGFAKMEGEDEASDDPRAFSNAKPWQRIIVLAAGGVFNLIAGLIICVILVAATKNIPVPIVTEFTPGYTFEQAGAEIGDKIVAINGRKIRTQQDVIYNLQDIGAGTHEITFEGGKTIQAEAVLDENGTVRLGYVGGAEANSFWNTLKYGSYQFMFVSKSIMKSLADLVTGKIRIQQLSGPVGIVEVIGSAVGEAAKQPSAEGLWNVASIFLLITINLGIFNLLPFPALDGARIVFVLAEMVRRKKIPPEKEGIVHFIGLALLILLMLFATGNDIVRLVKK